MRDANGIAPVAVSSRRLAVFEAFIHHLHFVWRIDGIELRSIDAPFHYGR